MVSPLPPSPGAPSPLPSPGKVPGLNELPMYFYAGFLGVSQDKKSLALRPVIGWAVVDKEKEEMAKMNKRRRPGKILL